VQRKGTIICNLAQFCILFICPDLIRGYYHMYHVFYFVGMYAKFAGVKPHAL
jgi:hypothetical protein